MVKHIVTFKLHGSDELRRKIAEDFKAALLALPEKIECLQSMEVGINENPAEDWDVVLTALYLFGQREKGRLEVFSYLTAQFVAAVKLKHYNMFYHYLI